MAVFCKFNSGATHITQILLLTVCLFRILYFSTNNSLNERCSYISNHEIRVEKVYLFEKLDDNEICFYFRKYLIYKYEADIYLFLDILSNVIH